jgi:hypothetical protein
METKEKTNKEVEQVLHLSIYTEEKELLQLCENKAKENSKKKRTTFTLDIDGQEAELTLPGLKSLREMIDQAMQIISSQTSSQEIPFEITD